MTSRFRIERATVRTTGGDVTYSFDSPLTVLAGSVGVGKSTLFELFKYGLGGDALLADVVRSDVVAITLDLVVGSQRYRVQRTIGEKRVEVIDLVERASLEDHFVDAPPTLNSLLMRGLGLPEDALAASRSSNNTRKGSRITFNDVFRYMYVTQGSINEEIAGSDDSYYTPKRKAVFELLFAFTTPEILATHSQIASKRAEHEDARRERDVVLRFLSDTRTHSRMEADVEMHDATQQAESAAHELRGLETNMSLALDRETQTLRDLLNESEANLAHARSTSSTLAQQRTDFRRERDNVLDDIGRIERVIDSGERVAQIEFVVCPRCMQDLRKRTLPDDVCRLCTLPDPVVGNPQDDQSTYELRQLRDQHAELNTQVEDIEAQLLTVEAAITQRSQLVASLSEQIRERTASRITPQLQAYADATRRRTEAIETVKRLEKTLQQWDRADDLARREQELSSTVESLISTVEDLEATQGARREALFDDLDEEFNRTVQNIGVPGVSTARIDRKTYLPLLNGEKFEKFSPVGGVRTATQVCYWVTLLTVALRRRDTAYPAFLLLDSPRTSLNDSDDLSAALYRRLVTMADLAGETVQLIVADNELPAEYRRDYSQFNFDYEHPTIAPIHHPGRESVTTINARGEAGS